MGGWRSTGGAGAEHALDPTPDRHRRRGNSDGASEVGTPMTTFGIIGAGNIGSNVARAVIAQGHDVILANSRGPETLTELIDSLGPQARAGSIDDAAATGEVVLVAVPLRAYPAIPVEPLAGKIVLDANNYYWERDGRIPSLDTGEATSTGLLQEHLPQSRVAKAFNHIRASEIPTTGSPAGRPGRRALATASDFPEAIAFVTALYDELGFDTVAITPLSESWRVERDRPAYGIPQTKGELEENLARAPRLI